MRFNLIANGELLGSSELEGADPSMGVRGGRFAPHANYSKYRGLFREHSRLRMGLAAGEDPPGEYRRLRAQIDSLGFRLETDTGEEVATSRIDLEDFSEDLGDEGYELSVVVDGRGTYEKFFG